MSRVKKLISGWPPKNTFREISEDDEAGLSIHHARTGFVASSKIMDATPATAEVFAPNHTL